MRLEAGVDSKAVQYAIAELGRMAPEAAKNAVTGIVRGYVRYFARARMSGRPGLMRRSGALTGSLVSSVSGNSIRSLEGRVGFADSRAAMIARVHELGTVGKGGTLPDIVPKTKKWLRFPRPQTGAAMAPAGPGGFVFAKKVSIPPRLQYHATWRTPEWQRQQRQILDQAASDWAKRKGRR